MIRYLNRPKMQGKLQAYPEQRTNNATALSETEYLNMVVTLDENIPDGLQKKFFLISPYELAWRVEEDCNGLIYYFKQELDNSTIPTGRIEYKPVFGKTTQRGTKGTYSMIRYLNRPKMQGKLQAYPEKRTSNATALSETEYLNMVVRLDENIPDGLQKKFFLISSYELAWRVEEDCNGLIYYFKQELDNSTIPTGRIEYKPVFGKTTQRGAKLFTNIKWLVENKIIADLCPTSKVIVKIPFLY
ncbi:hypothetical protein FQR65_LT10687 [Abscondita terminalis]|nr:hypothetical protein FQR65_LT10687 [Abscondita terminalis]